MHHRISLLDPHSIRAVSVLSPVPSRHRRFPCVPNHADIPAALVASFCQTNRVIHQQLASDRGNPEYHLRLMINEEHGGILWSQQTVNRHERFS